MEELEAWAGFPFLIWAGDTLEDYFSAFPFPPGGTPALKCLEEQLHEVTTPAAVDRAVGAAEPHLHWP